MLLNDPNEIRQLRTTAFAKIENLALIRPVDAPDDPVDDVPDVSVIPARAPIPELLYLDPPANPVDELERCHVGTTPLPEYGEKTVTCGVDTMEVRERVGHQLEERVLGRRLEFISRH